MHTNTVKTLSTVTTWHSQRSLEWYTYLGRVWGTLPWKIKVNHSVLSSSDVGRKWRLLCAVLHPNTARELLARHWCYGCVSTTAYKSALNAAGNATPILWGVSNLGQSMPLKTMFTPCLRFIFLFHSDWLSPEFFARYLHKVEECPNILMLSAVLNAFSAPLSIPHCTTQAFKLNFHRNSLKTLASLSSLCTSGNTVTAAQARRKWRTDYNRWGRKLAMQTCQSTPVVRPYAMWRHTAWESKRQA